MTVGPTVAEVAAVSSTAASCCNIVAEDVTEDNGFNLAVSTATSVGL
jgi:hypothetical protein